MLNYIGEDVDIFVSDRLLFVSASTNCYAFISFTFCIYIKRSFYEKSITIYLAPSVIHITPNIRNITNEIMKLINLVLVY